MPLSGNQIDAGFYQLIHQLVCSSPQVRNKERRGYPRRPFTITQRIAPRRGAGVPDESEFFDVTCHDLNRAGFSFLLPTRPNFSALVVLFDKPPDVVYMGAEVLHCASVLVYPSGHVEHIRGRAGNVSYQAPDGQLGTPMVLVGCRFTGQLQK